MKRLKVINKKSGMPGEITDIANGGFIVKCEDNFGKYGFIYHSIEELTTFWEDL